MIRYTSAIAALTVLGGGGVVVYVMVEYAVLLGHMALLAEYLYGWPLLLNEIKDQYPWMERYLRGIVVPDAEVGDGIPLIWEFDDEIDR